MKTITKTYNANNQFTTNTYNEFGRLVTSTDYAGTPTGYTYDSLGRLTSQTITIENGKTSTTKYEYDAAGNIIREWNQINAVGSVAAWNKTEYEYDNRNRLTSVKQYDGNTLASTTNYTYDGVGNVLTMTSGGKTTTYTYDRFGNVLTEKDALNNTKTCHYNGIGRLESVTDKNGVETEYFYDALGRILKTEAADNSGTEVQLFTYSKTGQVLSKANEDTTTSYTYDDLGRVETITELYEGYSNIPEYEDPAPEPVEAFIVTLDPNGGALPWDASATITVQNGETYSLPTPSRTRYTFLGWYYGDELIENGDTVNLTEDATFAARWSGIGGIITDPITPPIVEMGEEDEEESSAFPLEETTENAVTTQSYCKTYTYDLAGNRISFTLEKSGETVHNINYSYDNLNRLLTVSENGAVEASYTYDTNGNRASLTLGNGVVTTYSYNLANWVTNLSNKNSDGDILSSYSYEYYASGNQKSKTDNAGKVTSYVYDGLGRLKSESESGGVTLNYFYDKAGNRTKLTATGTESYVIDYSYNAVNQLTSEVKTESGATETTSYTYDANGNMLSKTSPEGTQANSYNNLNQLVSSITAGVTSSYTYNVDGIRTSKTVGTATTDYLLDGGNVVGEVENGAVTATYLRGANLLSMSADDETNYYLFNAHGDVTALTNGAQTVTKSYDYDAFGNEKNPSATDDNPFRYCGEYYDTETGTYYLRARYYDPVIGRFTSQDPIKDGFNWYAYCYNNPLSYKDPTGLSGIMPDGTYYITHPLDEILLKLKQEYLIASEERKLEILKEEAIIRSSGEEGVDWSVRANKPIEHYYIDTDVTDKLNNIMITSEKENAWKKFLAVVPISNIVRYIDFAYMVKPGGKYDLKSQDEWKGREHFIYQGKIIWYDDPGNILYGYLGKAMGFHDIVLKSAAGIVQIATNTSSWDYADSFFDDPRDQSSISTGISIYNKNHYLLPY